ncbi:MAG TPA: BCAM0308 family protein [Nitrosomonas sp.]|nr:BCAM0308 family protein [Nitrosomonas sp.]HMY61311.1 BCAM0308 family protein [Nitrosomonas sp.]HNC40209.1 BCAM0308 family protein [Nitrosomonas sp.]HND35808.1 BCAM0308 family protein [Nitrosomonas sp.]HNG35682.1 BCAM0308 family protein [Nitrosomonas sp.]
MSHSKILDGYRAIPRHDGIFKEEIHDTYQLKSKLAEPTVCSQCQAVYHQGRWQWLTAPASAHQGICPACHRIRDDYPAGYLTLQGVFYLEHREEIMHLVRNHEKHQCTEHPLKRIMKIEESVDLTLVTTTDIHLVRGMGEAIHHAYQGDLEFRYNPEENRLRVYWKR